MEYQFTEMKIQRSDNAKMLYLTKYECELGQKGKNILLIHGLTYAQFVFDIKYKDYSMCEYLAQKGYIVWRLDLGGYGKSDKYENGWEVNTVNAAKDVVCAMEEICSIQNVDKMDLLGWSWGTMITAKVAEWYPEKIRKIVWMGPCFGGAFDAVTVDTPFVDIDDEYINRVWRKNPAARKNYDMQAVEPMLWNMWNLLAYRQNTEKCRPAGGAREIMEAGERWLIEPENVHVPVLILTGDIDFYVNVERCYEALEKLSAGSELCHFEHAGHAMYLEREFYQKSRERIIKFLEK